MLLSKAIRQFPGSTLPWQLTHYVTAYLRGAARVLRKLACYGNIATARNVFRFRFSAAIASARFVHLFAKESKRRLERTNISKVSSSIRFSFESYRWIESRNARSVDIENNSELISAEDIADNTD